MNIEELKQEFEAAQAEAKRASVAAGDAAVRYIATLIHETSPEMTEVKLEENEHGANYLAFYEELPGDDSGEVQDEVWAVASWINLNDLDDLTNPGFTFSRGEYYHINIAEALA